MRDDLLLLLPILLPIAAGLALLCVPAFRVRKARIALTASVLVLNLLTVFALLPGGGELELLHISEGLSIAMRIDGLSRIFTPLVSVMWLLAGVYSYEYMHEAPELTGFYAFYLLSLGALIGLGYAANYLTMYLCFELATLLTTPLVMYERTQAARSAGVKYLLYSIGGAALGLLGMVFLYVFGGSLEFAPGGALSAALRSGGFPLVVVFLTVLGFSAKAGMFPLHAWLPTAHPEAPSPASAVLSGVITKAGVIAIVRVIYYVVGVDALSGTWVQYAWLSLALLTVAMGSMMAYREKLLKKRMAYSTVSQVSYILLGVFLMNADALTGALLHLIAHSVIKNALFFCCGAIIYKTACTRTDELEGLGRRMPVVMLCFTAVSMALIGIPPFSGFVSKWFLSIGALRSELPLFSWLGPVVLLFSALLTAAYLFTITIKAFFPQEDHALDKAEKCEPTLLMTAPLVLLALAALLIGMFPQPVMSLLAPVVGAVL